MYEGQRRSTSLGNLKRCLSLILKLISFCLYSIKLANQKVLKKLLLFTNFYVNILFTVPFIKPYRNPGITCTVLWQGFMKCVLYKDIIYTYVQIIQNWVNI